MRTRDGRAVYELTAAGAPDHSAAVTIDRLTPEVGWLLVTAGVVGVILPGLPGALFLLAGLIVVTPCGTKRRSS